MAVEDTFDTSVTIANQKQKEKDYWLGKLSGELVKNSFYYDHKENENCESKMESVKFSLPQDLAVKMITMSNGSDRRLHMILTASIALLIAKYSCVEDVIIGTPVIKQDMEAKFVNTALPIRNNVLGSMSFKELLFQVRQTITEATENQNYPVKHLPDQLCISRTGRSFPLFEIAVLLKNIHSSEYIKDFNLNVIFSFHKVGDVLSGIIEYNSLVYERTTIIRIADYLQYMMGEVLLNIDKPLRQISNISKNELERILNDFNNTGAEFPRDKTVQQIFEEQASRTPDNIAVMCADADGKIADNQTINYRKLNVKSNQLARILRRKGVKPESIVGILIDNTMNMMVAILGVLKAGGAYLPLDPDYPNERIMTILSDCKAVMLITKKSVADNFSFTALQGIHHLKEKPFVTGTRPNIADLDSLPIPDRSLIDYEKYANYVGQGMIKNTYINILTARGCPYGCTYCHKIWPNRQYVRSAENIFEEVCIFYNMGVRRFVIVDDIFNLNVANSSRFFEMLIEHKMDVQLFFSGGLRGDILTKDYIDLMVKAGTVSVALALETASPRLQKLIKKNLNIERFRENIEYFCSKYPQVILELFTIHGFPTETEEEAIMTLDFIKSLKWVHMPYLNILRIYQNTDMEKTAMENGISRENIIKSENLAFYELPETLPFSKNFSTKVQSDFMNEYFLDKQRLLHVLPYQMKVFTEKEIVQKYDTYLPVSITTFDELLEFAQITKEELNFQGFLDEDYMLVPDMNKKLKEHFPERKADPDALKVLFLDLSQYFSCDDKLLYDVYEPPLGHMYLLTYLYEKLGSKINGRICKSRVDFDNYNELKKIIDEFKPDVIGIRTLTLYKDFMHKSVAMIRQWGIDVPIITGGPYAVSGYDTVLQDPNIDLVVLGEGEITLFEVIEKIIEAGKRLPGIETLKEIKGLAFIPERVKVENTLARDVIMLDIMDGIMDKEQQDNLEPVNSPGDLAYIIYTSGSTGEPKGIMEEHEAFIDFVSWAVDEFEHREGYQALLSNSYASAGAIQQIFPPLVTGGTLHLIDPNLRKDIEGYVNYLKLHKINNIDEVPVILHVLFDILKPKEGDELLPDLTCLSVGSEYIPIELIRKCKKYLNHQGRIINAYGQAEAASETCTYHFDGRDINEKSLIGKPRRNLKVYIVNYKNELCPIGVPGELCVSGVGIARGYVNKPELTALKFVRNTFSGIEGDTLYKTGDIARWLPDGNVEFLGRVDHQVKIRGNRIELGEIESQIRQYKYIKDVVVMARDDSNCDKYICAYFVSDKEISVTEIRDYLKQKLPEYMIPVYFVQLDKIPLNPNGKVNRKAFPEPGKYKISMSSTYVMPESDLEKVVADVWCEVLGVDRVGIDDNFFELGGHSLNIIQLSSKLKRVLDRNIPAVTLFRYSTIRQFTEYLGNEKVQDGSNTKAIEESKLADERMDMMEETLLILGGTVDVE